MLQKTSGVCGFLLLIFSFSIQAEMYKHVDEKGQVTYSNVPSKGAKKVDLAPITVLPRTKTKPPEPSSAKAEAPSGDAHEVAGKSERLQAVQESLAKEQTLLVKAKLSMEEEKNRPETFKTKVNGKEVTRRAVNRYEGKIKELQDEITLHEKNIEALKKELATLQ